MMENSMGSLLIVHCSGVWTATFWLVRICHLTCQQISQSRKTAGLSLNRPTPPCLSISTSQRKFRHLPASSLTTILVSTMKLLRMKNFRKPLIPYLPRDRPKESTFRSWGSQEDPSPSKRWSPRSSSLNKRKKVTKEWKRMPFGNKLSEISDTIISNCSSNILAEA